MPPYSTLMATIQKVGYPHFSFLQAHCDSTDVERAVDIAFQYRHHFRKDVIIDLLVYRRWCVLIYFSLSGLAKINVNSTLIGVTMSLTSLRLHNP